MPSRAHSRFSRRHLWTGADQPRNAFVLRERDYQDYASSRSLSEKRAKYLVLYYITIILIEAAEIFIIKLTSTRSSYLFIIKDVFFNYHAVF